MASSGSVPKPPSMSKEKMVSAMMRYLDRIEERVQKAAALEQDLATELEGIQSALTIIYDAVLMWNNPEGDGTFLRTLEMIGASSFKEWEEAGFATAIEATVLRVTLESFIESYNPNA